MPHLLLGRRLICPASFRPTETQAAHPGGPTIPVTVRSHQLTDSYTPNAIPYVTVGADATVCFLASLLKLLAPLCNITQALPLAWNPVINKDSGGPAREAHQAQGNRTRKISKWSPPRREKTKAARRLGNCIRCRMMKAKVSSSAVAASLG